MTLNKPIIIIGTGRCGSTIFHDIFSRHPEVAWLSGLNGRYPTKPYLARQAMNAIDWPIINQLTRKYVQPGEVYQFWNYFYRGFGNPFRDLLAEDVLPGTGPKIQKTLSSMLNEKRNRIIIKITGWPRIGFLNEIFKDAKFIHIIRDGRAVVNSLLKWHNWDGWQGPNNWKWGALDPTQIELWQRHNTSFIVLAGLEWNILVSAFQESKHLIDSDRLLEIRYEDLCANPHNVFEKVLKFSELSPSVPFFQALKKNNLVSANDKWRNDLTPMQQETLAEVLEHFLSLYNYSEIS